MSSCQEVIDSNLTLAGDAEKVEKARGAKHVGFRYMEGQGFVGGLGPKNASVWAFDHVDYSI